MTTDEANVAPARLRCEGRETNKWKSTRRCWRVATVTINGRRYCLTCAKAAK